VVKESNLKIHSYVMGARLQNGVERADEINTITEEIAAKVDHGRGLPYAKAYERSIGKGCLINKPKKKGIPQGKCTELNTCLGERSPFNPAMVWIDPYGNVMICYGIIIGNLYQNTLNKILNNYSADNYPLLRELAKDGPKALHHVAEKNKLKMSEYYYDECDVCYQSRSALRSLFPKVLGPAECYPV
jgi:hypothetical protein